MSDQLRELAGYASLFGTPDLSGDVVHAGAFAKSLRDGRRLPLLLEHDPRLVAGAWIDAIEDARGLFVRGALLRSAPAASLAMRRLEAGVDGLSIGFHAVRSRARTGGGRDLLELALHEVSVVRAPMLPQARLLRAKLVHVSTENAL